MSVGPLALPPFFAFSYFGSDMVRRVEVLRECVQSSTPVGENDVYGVLGSNLQADLAG